MRRLVLPLTGALAILTSQVLALQSSLSPLTLVAIPDRYISPTYARQPQLPATRMIFEGESISLRVEIRNEGESTLALIGGESPGFQVGITRLDGKPGALLTPRSSEILNRVYLGNATEERWSPRISIAPREMLRWTVALPL